MRKNIFIIMIGFFFLGVFSAHASDYMTLENSITMAIERNPAVKAQDQDVLGKDMDKRSQVAKMLPSVDLSYGYVRLQDAQTISLPLIGAVPLSSTGIYSTDIKAKQVLFTGGALYNSYLIAQNDKLSAEFDREKFIRDLKLLVIDTYYGVINPPQSVSSPLRIRSGLKVPFS